MATLVGFYLDRDISFEEREREYIIRRDNRYNESRSKSEGGGNTRDNTDTNINPMNSGSETGGNLASAPSSAEWGGGTDTNVTNSVTNEITGENQTLRNDGDSASSSDITVRAIGDAEGDGEVLNDATDMTTGNAESDTSIIGTPRRLFRYALSMLPGNVAQNQGNDQRGEGEMGQ